VYAVKPVNTAEFADSEEFQLVSHKLEKRYAVFLLLRAFTLQKGISTYLSLRRRNCGSRNYLVGCHTKSNDIHFSEPESMVQDKET
jgi:hypothetical protein